MTRSNSMGERTTPDPNSALPPAPRRRRISRRIARLVAGLLLVYLVAAYLIVPALWLRYARRHPAFDDVPRITSTADHHPADPLNVALIGTEKEVKKIMVAAKWY